jgi:hypothetical protein
MGLAADILGLPQSTGAILRGLLTSAIADGIKVTAWARGAPTRAVYRSMADFAKTITDAIGEIADFGILEASSGEPLNVLAKEVYGILFPGATFATTTLLIDNAGGGEYPYSPDNPLLLTSSVTKKIYTSLGTGVIVGLTNAQPLSVIAKEAGWLLVTKLVGAMDALVGAMLGGDQAVMQYRPTARCPGKASAAKVIKCRIAHPPFSRPAAARAKTKVVFKHA